ncbi:hypothetical protein C1S80_29215 [Mycolicibacterium aubagnense]|nr:hypothetical protein C1S80_29215 [Mycolicibacterium aubagnense]
MLGQAQKSATGESGGEAHAESSSTKQIRADLMNLAAEVDPRMAPIVEAAGGDLRMSADGTLSASPALRAAMRALVPGRDKAPASPNRLVADWLSADTTNSIPVSETSPYFTVSHWHWMAAKELVRRMPAELGPTFPHLFVSEAQIIHDLKAWSALNQHGQLTDEAAAMFGAITGHASLTVYGTVLLYAQRRPPVELPATLKKFGLAAAVRDVPRVTFTIGVTDREVVTVLLNNTSVIFTRRLRSTNCIEDDAAKSVLDLLDPDEQWPAYQLKAPIMLPGSVVDDLATDPDTTGLIVTEPDEESTDAERAADAARRDQVRNGARRVLAAARTPAAAAAVVADIAASTTHALAQVTVRTDHADVARGDQGALAIVFLRGRGVLASYPSGSGHLRRVTYAAGNRSGIKSAIEVLGNAYREG